MFILKVLLCFGVLLNTISANSRLGNVFQLKMMVERVTEVNGYAFNNYGCYCGYGGCGNTTDDIDKCCKAHDECYANVTRYGSCYPRFRKYTFEATMGHAECMDENGTCAYSVCKCDKDVAECFYKHLDSYDIRHKFTYCKKKQVCGCSREDYREIMLRFILNP